MAETHLTLPGDLVRYLFHDYLDVQSLKSFGLTCKVYANLASTELFRRSSTVTLKNAQAFHRLLEDNTEPIPPIRRLVIKDLKANSSNDSQDVQPLVPQGLDHDMVECQTERKAHSSVLKILKKAVEHCSELEDITLDFKPLPLTHIQALCSLKHITSFTTKHMDYGSLTMLWNAWEDLKYLKIQHLTSYGVGKHNVQDLQPRQMQSLYVPVEYRWKAHHLRDLLNACQSVDRVDLTAGHGAFAIGADDIRIAILTGLADKKLQRLTLRGDFFTSFDLQHTIPMDLLFAFRDSKDMEAFRRFNNFGSLEYQFVGGLPVVHYFDRWPVENNDEQAFRVRLGEIMLEDGIDLESRCNGILTMSFSMKISDLED